MSILPAIVQSESGCVHFLSAPFDTLPAEDILKYFKTRQSVRYFPVADQTQVTREKIDAILLNRFEFNEESYQLTTGFDWKINPSPDIEWHIMQHKFYYAVGLGMAFSETGDARYAEKWMELTTAWIASVPVNFLTSDVIGRRVQNWIFSHYYFITLNPSPSITPEFYRNFLTSLHQQVSYLCGHLTPARNHRTLELYSIFLAAVVFPEFKDAPRWLTFATNELLKNTQADFLSDGVHCELSTDYHHIVLRNLLGIKKLAVLNSVSLPAKIDDTIKKALLFSIFAHKPDGKIPSLSDGDPGSFLSLLAQGYELYGCEEMHYVASQGKSGKAPEQRYKAFAEGGYYILRSGWGSRDVPYQDEKYLIFDCGPLGAGNHGHLDLLSFEMAAYGQSLIVDPGRYTYDESGETNWRVLFRGTAYHNTVMVDGKNQTRYEFHKEKFKIKGLPPLFEMKAFACTPEFSYVHGIARSHEYAAVHERKILFLNSEYWVICDLLSADALHDYDLLFHLSANAQSKISFDADLDCIRVDSPHLIVAQPQDSETSLSIVDGYVSPSYGIKHPAPVLRFSRRATCCAFYTILYPFKQTPPSVSVAYTPIVDTVETCATHEVCSLTITLEINGRKYKDKVFCNHRGDGKEYRFDRYKADGPALFVREDDQGRILLNQAVQSEHFNVGNHDAHS